ncbi:hypothetical protein [Dyadobacter sp. Leaf189]|nr:hypothetical protein [Dyadobacter sp. Leaf189]
MQVVVAFMFREIDLMGDQIGRFDTGHLTFHPASIPAAGSRFPDMLTN